MSNSFGLNISEIKNAALQKLAWTCDIDDNKGYLSKKEYEIFKLKAEDLKDVSDEDFNQAMGLYKSEPTNNETPATKAETEEAKPVTEESAEEVVNTEETANTEAVKEEPAAEAVKTEGTEEPVTEEGVSTLANEIYKALSSEEAEESEEVEETEKPAEELTSSEDETPKAENTEEAPQEEIDPFEKVSKMVRREESGTQVISDIISIASLNSPDNSLSQIYKAAPVASGLQAFVEDVSGEIQKIEDEEKQDEIKYVRTLKYKDKNNNEKQIKITQSLSLGGVFNRELASNKTENTANTSTANEADETDETDKITDEIDDEKTDEKTETTDEQNNNKVKNNLNGGVHYSLMTETIKTKAGFNAHLDNDNQDIYAFVQHNTKLKNDGQLKITGAGRITIDQGLFNGHGGAAVDYRKDDLSAGVYGQFEFTSEEAIGNDYNYEAEAHVNYKDKVRGKIGVTGYSTGYISPYIGGTAFGEKDFGNGLTISGSVSADAQYIGTKVEHEDKSVTNVRMLAGNITAKGNLNFKASDKLRADVDGMLVYNIAHDFAARETSMHELGAILKGSIIYGKTKAYTNLAVFKDFTDNSPLVTAAATAGIQRNDFFKKGLAAFVEGTVCNTKNNNNPDSSIAGIKTGVRLNF